MKDVADVVANAWRAVLEISRLTDTDDFFMAGGTSFTAIKLMEIVESELSIQFPIEVLFTEGTLTALISECERRVLTGGRQPA